MSDDFNSEKGGINAHQLYSLSIRWEKKLPSRAPPWNRAKTILKQ
jgi:hypothetical protein